MLQNPREPYSWYSYFPHYQELEPSDELTVLRSPRLKLVHYTFRPVVLAYPGIDDGVLLVLLNIVKGTGKEKK